MKFESDDDHGRGGPDFDHKYSAKSGSAGIKVNVKASFGTIILGEASEEEMKEKSKPKQKVREV